MLSKWLVAEGPRGQAAMSLAMQNPYSETPEDPAFMEWHSPMSDWADEMINAIASWMRGTISDEEIQEALRLHEATSAADRQR